MSKRPVSEISTNNNGNNGDVDNRAGGDNDEEKKRVKTDENARDLLTAQLHPCTHEVCLPKDLKVTEDDPIFNPPLPAKLVREYPFVLDNFQRKAIGCMERRESVLVAAHTSAGKTVCAE